MWYKVYDTAGIEKKHSVRNVLKKKNANDFTSAGAKMNLEIADKHYKGRAYVFASNRQDTFSHWPFITESSTIRADKLAEAGFVCTNADKNEPCAACVFCGKELEFEEGDIPWDEHVKRGENCDFVKINKLDERTWTVKDYLLLLAAAHAQEEIRQLRADFEIIKTAGNEVKKMIASLKK